MSARCTFHIGPFYFGIPVEAVQEVLRGQTLTPVPLAPPAVKGLLNLRGDIVTVLDLSETLGVHPRRAGSPPLHVLIRDRGEVVSLCVDRIGEVAEVEESLFEPPPEMLQGTARELIRGAYKLSDRLLLVLDVSKAMETAERGSPAGSSSTGGPPCG